MTGWQNITYQMIENYPLASNVTSRSCAGKATKTKQSETDAASQEEHETTTQLQCEWRRRHNFDVKHAMQFSCNFGDFRATSAYFACEISAPCNDVREYFRKMQHWRSHLWLEIRRKVGRDEAVDAKTDDDHEGREKAARVSEKVKRWHRRGVFLDWTEKNEIWNKVIEKTYNWINKKGRDMTT